MKAVIIAHIWICALSFGQRCGNNIWDSIFLFCSSHSPFKVPIIFVVVGVHRTLHRPIFRRRRVRRHRPSVVRRRHSYVVHLQTQTHMQIITIPTFGW